MEDFLKQNNIPYDHLGKSIIITIDGLKIENTIEGIKVMYIGSDPWEAPIVFPYESREFCDFIKRRYNR